MPQQVVWFVVVLRSISAIIKKVNYMLQRDYLVRLFTQFASTIRQTFLSGSGKHDPEAASDLLEATICNATEFDGELLLRMDPQTMVSMFQISATDSCLIQYISRALLLDSVYLNDANNISLSQLREGQAFALAQSFGFELSKDDILPDALESFFADSTPSN